MYLAIAQMGGDMLQTHQASRQLKLARVKITDVMPSKTALLKRRLKLH